MWPKISIQNIKNYFRWILISLTIKIISFLFNNSKLIWYVVAMSMEICLMNFEYKSYVSRFCLFFFIWKKFFFLFLLIEENEYKRIRQSIILPFDSKSIEEFNAYSRGLLDENHGELNDQDKSESELNKSSKLRQSSQKSQKTNKQDSNSNFNSSSIQIFVIF